MAKSRRRMTKSPGPRPDWVYRSDLHDEAGGLVDPWGTYEQVGAGLVSGQQNAIAQVLYDGTNYLGTAVGMGANVPIFQPRAARAEGNKAKVHMVDGWIGVIPSTWALGSVFNLGIRFGVFEQDEVSGAPMVPIEYNMWGYGGAITQNVTKPAVFANTRNWDRELRRFEAFNTGAGPVRFNYRFRFKANRRLRPHECYGVYAETQEGSVTLSMVFFLRSLVSDEG